MSLRGFVENCTNVNSYIYNSYLCTVNNHAHELLLWETHAIWKHTSILSPAVLYPRVHLHCHVNVTLICPSYSYFTNHNDIHSLNNWCLNYPSQASVNVSITRFINSVTNFNLLTQHIPTSIIGDKLRPLLSIRNLTSTCVERVVSVEVQLLGIIIVVLRLIIWRPIPNCEEHNLFVVKN